MATNVNKNSARLMINRLRGRLDDLFEEQEQLKANKKSKVKKNKIVPKAQEGGDDWSPSMKWNRSTAMTRPFNMDDTLGSDVTNTLADMSGATDRRTKSAGEWKSSGGSFLDKLGDTDWGNIGLGIAGLAPVGYNIGRGLTKPTQFDSEDFYNPYRGEIRSAMRDRKFDIDPILQGNLASYKSGMGNLRNASTSSGQYLSNLGTLSAGKQRADAAAYGQKSNVENQYLADQAKVDLSLGQSMGETDYRTALTNEQLRAARENMVGQGFSGLSQWAQMQQAMENEKSRDKDLAGVLADTLGPANEKFAPLVMQMLKNYGWKGNESGR